MAKGRGSGTTPYRVVELLKEAVEKTSQSQVAQASGLTRLTVQRYLRGVGEPSGETLQKLADYFDVSVAYLRGETIFNSPRVFDLVCEIFKMTGTLEERFGVLCELDKINDAVGEILDVVISSEVEVNNVSKETVKLIEDIKSSIQLKNNPNYPP